MDWHEQSGHLILYFIVKDRASRFYPSHVHPHVLIQIYIVYTKALINRGMQEALIEPKNIELKLLLLVIKRDICDYNCQRYQLKLHITLC